MANQKRPPATLATPLLVCVLLTIALLISAALRFPASTQGSGRTSLAASLALLLLYAAFVASVRFAASQQLRRVLPAAAKVGILIAAVAIANHLAEDFASLPAPLPAVLGVSMWALLFFCFSTVAAFTFAQTSSVPLSLIASLWSAMLSTVAIVLVAFSAGLLFIPHMELVLREEFLNSGMTDPRAFVVRNTLDAAASHLFITPIVAVLMALCGIVITALLRRLGRQVRIAIACLCPLLLLAGLTSIRHASALARSSRPPFILFGLATLALSLASAYPAAMALRRAPAPSPPL